jgi:uncharacterized MnhB-related membrane protein
MAEKLLLLAMIVLALVAIQTTKMRRAVVYLGAFSLVSSFAYLIYSAPDVAIAEAVIGSTLATVLYLIALKKYRVFTIYFTHAQHDQIDDRVIAQGRAQILTDIEAFLIRHELEPQIVYTSDSLLEVLARDRHDLLVYQDQERLLIYGNRQNQQLDNLASFLSQHRYRSLNYKIIRYEEGV